MSGQATADYPYNSLPAPSGCTMSRTQYDANNDGIVDFASAISDQTYTRFRQGFIERLYPDGFWYRETPEIVGGNPVISILIAPIQ